MSKLLEYLGWQRPAEPVEVSRTRMIVGLLAVAIVVVVLSAVLKAVF